MIGLFAFGLAVAPTSESWSIFSTPTARAVSATISGTLYNTTETAALATSQPIKLRTSAGISAVTTTATTTGTFSFAGVTVSDNDVVTIWLTGSTKAALVFKYGSSCTGYTDCTGLKLYQGRLALATYNGVAVANSDLGACDDDTNCADAAGENGDGRDGALSVTTGTTTINGTQTNITAVGANYVDVGSVTGFDNGTNNDVLVIQMTGTGIGNYETKTISSVSGSRITFTANLTKTYQATGAQIIRIPNYTTVGVSGGTLTAAAWNGTIGGVLVFRANGAVTVNGGTISMEGRGAGGGTGGAKSATVSAGGSGAGAAKADASFAIGSTDCDQRSNYYVNSTGDGNAGAAAGAGGGGTGGTQYATRPQYDSATTAGGCRGGLGNAGGAGTTRTAGTAGGAGSGTGGGAASTGASANGSGANLTTMIMGGGGGGAQGGGAGGGGGQGGGGGSAVVRATFPNQRPSTAGTNGTNGSAGVSDGAVGGAGGGIIIIKASSVTVSSGAITANGAAGGTGGTGGAGGAGGTGGKGAGCRADGLGYWAAGNGGSGGGGGQGGNGGQGGGGGAGGAVRIEADTVSLGTNLVTASGGGAGSGGTVGSGGGAGGAGSNDSCAGGAAGYVGNAGNAGANGTNSSGTAGGDGKIHVLAASDPTVTTSPAASHAGGYIGSGGPPGFTANANAVALTTGNTKIVVASGTTYAPGGNITAGQLEIAGTYTAGSETITLSGSGTSNQCTADAAMPFCSTGTFNAGTSKVVITGSANGGGAYGSSGHVPSFYDLEIAGSQTNGGVYTITHNLTVDNGVTITGANPTFNDGSSFDCQGTCSLAGGTFNGAVSTSGNWTETYSLVAANGAVFTASDTVTMGGTGGGVNANTTGIANFNNLTITTSYYGFVGDIRIGGVITANTDTINMAKLTMQDGSSMAGNGVISVAVLNINGTVTSTNPTKIYCSSSCGNLTVNAGGNFTHTGTFTFDYNGSINNTAGGSLTFNNLTFPQTVATATVNGDMTVNGTLTNSSTHVTTQASGTVTMANGSAITNAGTLTFVQLGIAPGATVTANTNFAVTASAQFGAGSTFTPSSGTVTFKNGSDIENSGGTVTFSGLTIDTNASVAASGSFGVGGTFTANSGSTFTPAAASVIGGSGTMVGPGIYKVTRNTGSNDFTGQYTIANKTLSGLTVDYSLTNQGVDNLSYGTLQFSGTYSNPLTATARVLKVPSGGSLTPSAGTITISDTGWLNQAGTGVLTAQNVSLAGGASISGAMTLLGTLTIPSGGSLKPTESGVNDSNHAYITGAGTITGQGELYGTYPYSPLSVQYTVSNLDISQMTVHTWQPGVGASYPDNLTYYNLTIDTGCCNQHANTQVTVTHELRVANGKDFLNNGTGSWTKLQGATVTLEGDANMEALDLIADSGASTISSTGTGYLTATRALENSIHVRPGASLSVTAPATYITGSAPSVWEVNNQGTLEFGDLRFNATFGTASISGGFTVNGTFRNQDTSSFTFPGTITFGDGSTLYDQTAGATYTNVTVAPSASVTASGSFPVAGTLTVNAGGTLDPNVNTVVSGAGTLTGTGTVKVNKATGTNDFATQYTISNKTISGLTVDFAGSGSDIDDLSYGSLKVSGSVTAATSPVVNGPLVVTGTLTPSAGSVSFGNGGSIDNAGTLTFYNLDIPNSVTITTNSNFSTGNLFKVDGTFSPAAASVLAGDGTLSGSGKIKVTRINGTAPLTEQYTIANKDYSSLTIAYDGSGTQAMTPMTYTNLEVDQPNVSGVASVSGNFLSVYVVGDANTKIEMTGSGWTISGFPVFNKFSIDTTPTSQPTANLTIAQNGTLSVETGATLAPTSGTLTLYPGVTFSGSGTLAPYSLVLTGSGTTTLPANLTVANALTIGNGHTLNLGTGTLTLTAQNPTVTNNGSISGASGTIEYAPVGTSGTTIPATTFYGHLKLNKGSNTFTVSPGTLSVGELNVAAGTLDMASNTVNARVASISISGTLNAPTQSGSLTVTGEWTNNGTFNHGNGTVVFAPSGDSALIQGSAETDFYNLRMIQPGKTLKVKTGIMFDVDGTLEISGLSGNPAFLESDTPGQTFILALASPATIDYVQLKDVACHASTATLTLGEHGDTRGNVGTCVVRIQRGGGSGAFAPGESPGGGTPTGGGTDVGGGAGAGTVATTGAKSPSSTGDTYNQWSNPTNAYSSNNSWAVGNEYSWINQDWGTFGLNIPAGATINGITVSIEYKDGGGCIGYGCGVDVYLSYDSGAHWTSAKSFTNGGNDTDQTQTLGGVSDTWGRSWSVTEMSDNNFLVRILVGPNYDPMPIVPHQLYVDHIQVNVKYTTAGTGGGAAQESPTPTPQPPTTPPPGGGEEGGGDGAAP